MTPSSYSSSTDMHDNPDDIDIKKADDIDVISQDKIWKPVIMNSIALPEARF